MTSSIEVKKEIEGRLSEANANEKYLYSRVMELEKRNQKLEKKVNKLRRKRKELKQEVKRLREKIQSQGSDSEEVEELIICISTHTYLNIRHTFGRFQFSFFTPIPLPHTHTNSSRAIFHSGLPKK